MSRRWQQAEGKRHALDVEKSGVPHPGEQFEALCGLKVTPKRLDFHEHGGVWLDPTCPGCDKAWRRIEHNPTAPLELAT